MEYTHRCIVEPWATNNFTTNKLSALDALLLWGCGFNKANLHMHTQDIATIAFLMYAWYTTTAWCTKTNKAHPTLYLSWVNAAPCKRT